MVVIVMNGINSLPGHVRTESTQIMFAGSSKCPDYSKAKLNFLQVTVLSMPTLPGR